MEVATLAHSVFLQNRTQFESSGSKGVLRVIRKTAGLPKGRNLYGNGVTIVPERINYLKFEYGRLNSLRKGSVTFNLICFKNSYSTGSTNLLYKENSVRLKLQSLSDRMSKFPNEVVDRNLIQILCKPEFLIMVYKKLNINLSSCNLAPELKSDIISGQFFKTIGDDIKKESFQFYRSQPHPGLGGRVNQGVPEGPGHCDVHARPGWGWGGVPSPRPPREKDSYSKNSRHAGQRMHLKFEPLTLAPPFEVYNRDGLPEEAEGLLKNKIVLEAVKLFLKIVFYSVQTPPKGLEASFNGEGK